MSRCAIFPGSFDPITYGHLDLIKRATDVFDDVVVAVAKNTQKNTLFSVDERVEMVKETTADIGKVRVESFEGLIIDYANNNNNCKRENHSIFCHRYSSSFSYFKPFYCLVSNSKLV